MGIIGSLAVCALLYVAVCLVLTGMIPYSQLDPESPLSSAFSAKGLAFIEGVIDLGAVVGLTTTLLVGLYAQSRLYMGVGRDGLLPARFFAQVNPVHHTPVKAQAWVGIIAGGLALLFDVSRLSHILSVGVLTAYGVVCMCIISLRLDPGHTPRLKVTGLDRLTRWQEATLSMGAVAGLIFTGGIAARLGGGFGALAVFVAAAGVVSLPLFLRQAYKTHPGFSCPLVPGLPLLGMAFNVYLLAQVRRQQEKEGKGTPFSFL